MVRVTSDRIQQENGTLTEREGSFTTFWILLETSTVDVTDADKRRMSDPHARSGGFTWKGHIP